MTKENKLLFVDLIIPMNYQDVISDAYIFLENGSIIDIGSRECLPEYLKSLIPEEYKNSVVIPGLINSHIHLAYENNYSNVLLNKQIEWIESLVYQSRDSSPELKFKTAKNNIRKCLQSGTTFVVENTPFEETVKAISESKLNSLIGVEVFSNNPINAEDDFAFSIKKLKNLHEKYPNLSFTLSPHSIYNSSSLILKLINNWSKENKKKILIHIAETDFEDELCKLGVSNPRLKKFYEKLGVSEPIFPGVSGLSPVEYMATLGCLDNNWHLTHLVKASEKDLQLVFASGASISICLRSNAFLSNGFPKIDKIQELGISTSFATDGLSSNFDLSLLNEIKYASFIAKSQGVCISAQKLFESITSVPAKTFCPDRGSLEIDKKADLLVYELSGEMLSGLKRCNENLYQRLLTDLNDESLVKVFIDGQESKNSPN